MATNINQLLAQNLQCALCLNVYTEPKLLTCSHTFCKRCLSRLLKFQKEAGSITCPICRGNTAVAEGDVGKLPTNIPIKSLIEDVKNQSQDCTICKADEKPLAATYCQECDDFMCISCYKTHAKWDKFSGHEIVKVEDIVSGKVHTKRRRKCKKHPTEAEECFCVDCKKYVCFRCGMMEQSRKGHTILEGMEHEDNQKEKVQGLRGRADDRKSRMGDYIRFVEDKQTGLQVILEQLTKSVNQKCEESIQQMKERRDLLIQECKRRIDGLTKELKDMKDSSRLEIGQIEDVSELVGNGVKVPLEGEALVAHDSLCQALEEIIVKGDPDYSKPTNAAKRGNRVTFQRIRCRIGGSNELDLGKIGVSEWVLGKTVDFAVKDSVNCVASMPDGRMAVGSRFGGLHLLSLQEEQEPVLKGVAVRRLVLLPDGRVVVRNIYNNISLYSKSFVKLEVDFSSLDHDKGGFGGLEFDPKGNYLISSYTKVKKMFFYPLTGGKPSKKISCQFEPHQIFAMRSGKLLAVTSDSTVSLLDESGAIKRHVTKDGILANPCVCLDGTILVAWVKHSEGMMTVEQYARDLGHLGTLITDFKIEKPQHPWYHLREFLTGDLAFCTPNKMYIFQQKTC